MMRNFILLTVFLCAAPAFAQSPITLQPAGRTKPFRLTISPSTQPTVLEASTNLVNWVALATNAANATPIIVTDPQSPALPRYGVQTAGAALSDLSQLANGVFMAPDGLNTVQYAPNGKLGFIVWHGRDLVYRERNGTIWTEQVIVWEYLRSRRHRGISVSAARGAAVRFHVPRAHLAPERQQRSASRPAVRRWVRGERRHFADRAGFNVFSFQWTDRIAASTYYFFSVQTALP